LNSFVIPMFSSRVHDGRLHVNEARASAASTAR
jgi:hypothetical protein